MMASHILRSTASSMGRACGSTIPAIPHTVRSLLSSLLRRPKVSSVGCESHRHLSEPAGTYRMQTRPLVELCASPEFQTGGHEDKEKHVELGAMTICGAGVRLVQSESQNHANYKRSDDKRLPKPVPDQEPIALEHHGHQAPPGYQLGQCYELSEIGDHPRKRRQQDIDDPFRKKPDRRSCISDIYVTAET